MFLPAENDRLGAVPQRLRLGRRLQPPQRQVLDLANALAGHAEGAADLLQGAGALAVEPVTQFDQVALALAGVCPAATPLGRGASFLLSRQQSDGGFAEPSASSSAALTAWAVLGLAASGRAPAQAQAAADYMAKAPAPRATDLELRLLAVAALGRDTSELADALQPLRQPSGRIGPALNSTYWGAIAFRAAGRNPGRATLRYLLHAQRKNGGWSWSLRAAPDVGDTAAAIQALRAAGASARSAPIKQAARFLRRCRNRDGGFDVAPGSASDAQSTAWAIQALLDARAEPGKAAFRYLKKLQRRDGSFRYGTRYVTTPTWVTAQVLCALARKPFPFTNL